MPAEAETLPPCPITGEPAVARLQWVPAKLLYDLWTRGARTDPAPLRRDSGRIGLYRAASGLAFFHPAFEGAASFYESLYTRARVHRDMAAHAATREDFQAAAALVRPGDAVLEVGCAHGAFAGLLPTGARYQGLEPNGTPPPDGPAILAETVAIHAARHAGTYDLACAFQVVEHVADPLALVRDMVACLRPGGRLVLAMPIWPSPHTDLPNNLVNLPPHHLSWWTEGACRALAAALGLIVERTASLPAYPLQAPLVWTWRLCPVRTRPGAWVQPRWHWHLAVGLSMWGGAWMARIFGLPRARPAVDVLLVARKPG